VQNTVCNQRFFIYRKKDDRSLKGQRRALKPPLNFAVSYFIYNGIADELNAEMLPCILNFFFCLISTVTARQPAI
jgi:hypothetical protein